MAQRRTRPFGQIKALDSGKFQASFPLPNQKPGQRKRVFSEETYATEREAQKWLNIEHGRISKGTWKPAVVEAPKVVPTLTEYHAEWMSQRRKKGGVPLAPKTVQEYRLAFVTYIEPAFGKKRLDAIAPPDVRKWHSQITAPNAAAKAFSHFKTVMETAVEDEYILTNPCKVKGAGTAPKRKKKITVLTVDQLNELVALMPAKYRAPTLLAAWGVLRWSELAGLQRADIDGTAVHVRRAVVRITGEPLDEGDTKSEAGLRTVYIPPGCARALEAHLAEFTGPAPDAWLMTARNDGPLSVTTYTKALKKAAAAIGHPELSAHMLRHSGNTWLRDDGASDEERMAQAGHADMIINAVYTHETAERLATLAERRAVREAKAAAAAETAEVLGDPDTMARLRESKADVAAGDVLGAERIRRRG